MADGEDDHLVGLQPVDDEVGEAFYSQPTGTVAQRGTEV